MTRSAVGIPVGFFVVLLGLAALAEGGGADARRRAKLGRELLAHIQKVDKLDHRAPEFPAGKEWFNSVPLRLGEELRGKVVVLDFWTYCCINCIHILPDLAELEHKYAGEPVAFVGVHSAKFEGEKVSENIRQAVLRYEIEHPVINDDEMAMWKAIPQVRSWPTLVVIGPRGNLLLLVAGEGQKDTIDATIAVALRYYPQDAFRRDALPIRLERDRLQPSPLHFPAKLAVDAAAGKLYISDSGHHRIVVTDLDGVFVEVIGSGQKGLVDGAYETATFHRLQGLALRGKHLWVADAENHALRRVDLEAKRVETIAGDGRQGRDREGGKTGSGQRLSTPWDVLARGERVFIAMAGTHQIWSCDPDTGVCRVFSGTGAEQNRNHTDRLQASWAQPSGLAAGDGWLFVADSESSAVRGIQLASGNTRTFVGGDDTEPRDLFAFGDRDGKGDTARLQHPLGVLWLEKQKRVLVADTYNHRLKLVDPTTRLVETFAGSGKAGQKDGTGPDAELYEPSGFALHPDGVHVFVADTNNHRIRKVNLETAEVTTVDVKGVPVGASAGTSGRSETPERPRG